MNEYRKAYNDIKTYIASGRPASAYFTEASQNIKEMRISYTSLGSTKTWIEWLLYMATTEESGNVPGAELFMIAEGE